MENKVKVITKPEEIQKIAESISKIKSVKAVYLFGSYARSNFHALSDIDLCIIGNLNEKEKNSARKYLSDNLDISFFNELPIWIKIRIFREGKPLVLKDVQFISELKIRTLKNYLDFKYIINKHCRETVGCMT